MIDFIDVGRVVPSILSIFIILLEWFLCFSDSSS